MGWEPEIREGDEPCTLLVARLDMAIDDRVNDFFVIVRCRPQVIPEKPVRR